MEILFFFFLIINILAFAAINYDKFLAKKHKRRIPEKTLLSFVFFGGTVGSGLGMLIFRHKTAKRSYLLKFFGIVIFQIVILYTFFIQK
ncbi:DUF1294 domain-containing protein [Flavobacterium granuli]|uniref:Uncharacterized membrane protein YsdA (DUF1294 family) n=1 Tax=Flavobacterium granuli TaxID=280093 RepID=A0A1M5KDC8_9FLAO|nr:DUF1294 domain-containing protein [Flavobacterium granuli]PRZ26250.1 uncharacterized membrane protein YsdA (DUF1294 family) [Flavobacterium granuli]SHG50757.1 Uncharacterized membrane protein YsdA, DUF1294 family [Flavobacterium granuli]